MTYKDYLHSKANDYKQHLLDEINTNTRLANIVNSLFFPLENNIQSWLAETEIKSFDDYRFRGDPFVNRICNRNEIDFIPSLNDLSDDFDRYLFFSCLKCDSSEEVAKKFPGFYHLMQEDFDERLDKIILDRLKDYQREPGATSLYSKKISDHITVSMGMEREHAVQQGIVGYTLPTLSINIESEGSIQFGTMDVRSLLLLPAGSFIFFYTDSHDYIIDKDLDRIAGVKRKNDEPVVYFLEEEQKYLVTNSRENIDRYIQIILKLSDHYFRVFEEWLIRTLIEMHLK